MDDVDLVESEAAPKPIAVASDPRGTKPTVGLRTTTVPRNPRELILFVPSPTVAFYAADTHSLLANLVERHFSFRARQNDGSSTETDSCSMHNDASQAKTLADRSPIHDDVQPRL
jgi:hypothetical protein